MNRPARKPSVQLFDVARIKRDPDNECVHDEEQIQKLMACLSEFGQQRAIIIDTTIKCIAGHGVLEAAHRLKWKKIRCKVSTLTGAKRAGYRLADNLIARLAEWDLTITAANLQAVSLGLGRRFTPEMLGLEKFEYDRIVHGTGAANLNGTHSERETVTLKIMNVTAKDRKRVLQLAQTALAETNYEARAY
jgi:hypothetical protein